MEAQRDATRALMRGYERIPGWLVPPFLVGAVLALGGAYWDDATHTEKGRDSFFIPPHIALYSGVALAGAGLGLWALLYVREHGLRAIREQRSLVLALVTIGVTLASGPIDNFWHLAFGRDAVLWSPPHMLGIVGTAGIAVAVLVELMRSETRWAVALRPLAGGMILAALAVSVMEYDTDVPQFAVVWYLPVLALASALALGLVKVVNPARFAATAAAAVHLTFIGAVALFLAAEGFDTPKLPLVIMPALVLDLLVARAVAPPVVAAAYVGALYAAYLPSLDLTGNGVRLDGSDVVVGAPIAFAAVLLVLSLIRPRRRAMRRGPALVAGVIVALQLSSSVAWAHDPGQGTLVGSVDLTARIVGNQARVTGVPHLGKSVQPVGLVARRAGVTEHARLARRGAHFAGDIGLPQGGRWFVYMELRRRGRLVESWLPVKVGEDNRHFEKPGRFAYLSERHSSSALKWIVGILVYGVVAGLLVAIARLARGITPDGERRRTGTAASASTGSG